MRIAILILAHKNADYLHRLVDHLKTDFHLFVHCDKRWKITLSDEENVTYLRHRFCSDWGSYRQILATLELLKAAHKQRFDRYILISGQDIPIKSNQYIKSFFSSHDDMNYVSSFERDTQRERDIDCEKLSLYWFSGNRFKTGSQISKITNKFLFFAEKIIQNIQRKFSLFRKIPNRVYGGENWVNLTHETLTKILDYLGHNPGFLNSLRFTHCADEMFMQILLENFFPDISITRNSLRYVDFLTGPEDPRILRIDDYQRIKESPALFARKIDPCVDASVIDAIFDLVSESRQS